MITYLLIAITVFFVGLLFAGKLRKKYNLYRDNERPLVVASIGFVSILWLFAVPVLLVGAFVTGISLLATSLLKRFEDEN